MRQILLVECFPTAQLHYFPLYLRKLQMMLTFPFECFYLQKLQQYYHVYFLRLLLFPVKFNSVITDTTYSLIISIKMIQTYHIVIFILILIIARVHDHTIIFLIPLRRSRHLIFRFHFSQSLHFKKKNKKILTYKINKTINKQYLYFGSFATITLAFICRLP